jgi:hypothetical protein
MIRRIAKTNDLKDLIKSCPSGVIDDITEIRYFISGHPETEIVATFEKVGSHLEAILPTSELSTLSNGVLMRRALYKVSDPAYPDGYYNLEFVDNLDVWLGEEETEDPFDPGYLTEGDLKTLNGESLVGVGNIDVVNYIPDYYATNSWVSGQEYMNMEEMGNYLTAHAYATEDWVRGQNYYIEATDDPVVTDSKLWYVIGGEGEDNPFVRENTMLFAISASLTGYATQSWVSSQQFATQSWVQSQGYITSAGLSGLATQSWVLDQGYITSETLPDDIATQSWVESYIYECDFAGAADVDTLSRWVVSQNYATQSWVSSQQFATQSWVSSQIETASDLVRYVDTFRDADWSAIDFSSGYVYINTKYTSSTYQGVLYSWGKLYDVTYNTSEGEYTENEYLTGGTLGNYLPGYDVATQS